MASAEYGVQHLSAGMQSANRNLLKHVNDLRRCCTTEGFDDSIAAMGDDWIALSLVKAVETYKSFA